MNIFVYGSSIFDPVVEALLGFVPVTIVATLPDHKRYSVVQPGRIARGPILLEEPGAEVIGRLLMGVDEESLKVLDKFESPAAGAPGYERILVFVTAGSEVMPAYVYRALPAMKEFASGHWSEVIFEQQHLNWYLEERIPDLKRQWMVK